jgi:hypothetical protein
MSVADVLDARASVNSALRLSFELSMKCPELQHAPTSLYDGM